MSKDDLADFSDKLSQVMPALVREFIRGEARELYHGHVTPPQVKADKEGVKVARADALPNAYASWDYYSRSHV